MANLRKINDNLSYSVYLSAIHSRVQDMAKEDQTSEIKEELYNLTQQFVRKYWRLYYPNYKGEIDDLVSDFYVEFETPKSREKGKEQTLLDKFDPKVTTLPYLVKVAVQRKLIDMARKDKGEINYSEKRDPETGELTLDYLAKHFDEPDLQVEEMEFTTRDVERLKALYQKMNPDDKRRFDKHYKDMKNILSPNFQKLFANVVAN